MGKSDEITKKLIDGKTEDELVKSGYDRGSVSRERNKIKLILELTKTANVQTPRDLDLKKLLIYAQYQTFEITWGTLIGMFGLAVAFKAMSQDGTGFVLLILGTILFALSLTILDRRIERLDPSKAKTSWWIILLLAVTGPIGLLLMINGLGVLLGLGFLELLKPLIPYSANSRLWPIMSIVIGILLVVLYFFIDSRRGRARVADNGIKTPR